ncbi:MAG: helix-turn-helix domain-containing protein [Planctomycetota bacterium]|jgi:transcriptional regulator with XRE-family HTH domain
MGKGHPQIQQDVGSRIRELRAKRNHTQESLALKSGLDRTYINSVENGRRNISVQALEKIILALDYTFKSFFSCEWNCYVITNIEPMENIAI